MSTRPLGLLFVAGASFAATAWAVLPGSPVAVSPGDAAGASAVEARCPTFSWGGAAEAHGYELLVYRLGEPPGDAQPVIRQMITGSARSWTPALDLCLERGGRYAWSVRGVGRSGASEWSPPSLFRIDPGPSRAEFDEALAIVRSYLEEPAKDDSASRLTPGPPVGSGGNISAAKAAAAVASAGQAGAPLGPGVLAATAPTPGTASLSVDGQIHLVAASNLFKQTGVLPITSFLWSSHPDQILALGERALRANSTGQNNTALGVDALATNSEGDGNTAVGAAALEGNTTGSFNVAVGVDALQSNSADDPATSGLREASANVAVGWHAMTLNDTGYRNVAIGTAALSANDEGHQNVALGHSAMADNEKGNKNVAVGFQALVGSKGDYNVALGFNAGSLLTDITETSNILINSDGVVGDQNTLRIGAGSGPGAGAQRLNRAFIHGIYGTVVGNNYPVCVLPDGQLGLCNPLPP